MRKIITTILPIMMMLLIASCDDQVGSSNLTLYDHESGAYLWPEDVADYSFEELSELMNSFQALAPKDCKVWDISGLNREGEGWVGRTPNVVGMGPGFVKFTKPLYPAYAGLNKVYMTVGDPIVHFDDGYERQVFATISDKEWIEKGRTLDEYNYIHSDEFKSEIRDYYRHSGVSNCLAHGEKGIVFTSTPEHENFNQYGVMTVMAHPVWYVTNNNYATFGIALISYRPVWRISRPWNKHESYESDYNPLDQLKSLEALSHSRRGAYGLNGIHVDPISRVRLTSVDANGCQNLITCIKDDLGLKP